ncbi:monosaccharide-sensing protein 2-like isoform X2 [Argentina anserina]|uniref:monosaccharide-sensing protein 2-like isoform X2 n=1 Tax=Argentina anserina TaxID=57926 RepID=UPI00217683B7|nr:monosaccharide-sensing protein 2-like isoform X2 [Potentilla anserina]
MWGAVPVAIAAAIGNLLQGWDNATIAGAVLYIKKEFKLETQPTIEGLIVAMSLIGATVITTFSGPVSDSLGRRPMLIISSVLYFLSGLVMLWAPNVYVLLLARLLDGFGIGLAVTLVPVYISETAPPDIRGLLNTLPQFTGSGGMFFSYCMVFSMSLKESPSWRLMLGVLSIPSLVYFALTVLYLPESPRWLVSKGRMAEAKQVLQKLRGREDVQGELALLLEGLGVGGDTSLEEYIIGPANDPDGREEALEKDQIRLYGPEDGRASLIARSVTGQANFGLVSRQGSMLNPNAPYVDPLVNLFGSVHEKLLPENTASMRSLLNLPNMGSLLNVAPPAEHTQDKADHWDLEHGDGVAAGTDFEDNARKPLLSGRHTASMANDMLPGKSINLTSFLGGMKRRNSLLMPGAGGEAVSRMDIGGGWQLAYKYSERVGKDGKKTEEYQRVYLHQEGALDQSRHGSMIVAGGGDTPQEGEYFQASALVSQPSIITKNHMRGDGPPILDQESAVQRSSWSDVLEPGVKRALFVGVSIQILQQFSGINGVLYYTPQILEQAGVAVLLSNLGLSSTSASILISGLTTLLMLPSIGLAMRLMDVAGRRSLLLGTLPILTGTLLVLIFGQLVNMGSVVNATISTISVVLYFCTFVMGFGPIPNILCSEIFPTRVRGFCIAICALTFWIGDIIVTYTLPILLTSIGLAGVFAIYAVVCTISWVFVFLKVPETKGMPLEVISEFFAVGAKQAEIAERISS